MPPYAVDYIIPQNVEKVKGNGKFGRKPERYKCVTNQGKIKNILNFFKE